MINTQNIFAITEIVVQIENQVQPCKFKAPVLVKGLNIVVDDSAKVIYEAADMLRPMSTSDFSTEIMQAINAQFRKLGLELTKIKEIKEQ